MDIKIHNNEEIFESELRIPLWRLFWRLKIRGLKRNGTTLNLRLLSEGSGTH